MEETTLRSILSKLDKLQAQVDCLKNENLELKQKVLNNDIVIISYKNVVDSLSKRVNKCIDFNYEVGNKVLSRELESLQSEVKKVQKELNEKCDQLFVDNETIYLTADNKLSCKKTFDKEAFIEKSDTISPSKLKLQDESYLSGDSIKSSMDDINYLADKINRLKKQLSTSNGYIASNNFKSSTPAQEKLTNFALSCLKGEFETIDKDKIPNGTKLKNTFDNHVWVFNRVTIDGLTTYKWEDFGSDNICIASNQGVHGLVTGSLNKLEGHIDLKGVITINGLKEELEQLTQGLLQLKIRLDEIEQTNSYKEE